VVHGWDQVASHLEDEDRQRQRGGNQGVAAQASRLRLALLGSRLAGAGGLRDLARIIARAVDGRDQLGGIGPAPHRGAFRRKVYGRALHARNGGERLFHPAHAGGAGHPLDGEDGRRRGHLVAHVFYRPHEGGAVHCL
jgi:hypothetical protein